MITPGVPYTGTDTLRELIRDNRKLLMVISRFGISLRHVARRVDELPQTAGVDYPSFLCVANLISGRPWDDSRLDLSCLTGYLKRAHTYFLDFSLPAIRRKLIEALDFSGQSDTAMAVMKFFDDYVGEVRRHMEYENETLFGYIDGLLAGNRDSGYAVGIYAEHHDAVAEKLRRLKDVLISYSPDSDADSLNSVLFDIMNCEDDLESHCRVEDLILVPAVRRTEEALPQPSQPLREFRGDSEAGSAPQLGKREREIVAAVAKGWSNKEIADRLCISVHTVATHRRNICSKLGIHSPAGLTVYAILNGLVELADLEL